MQDSSLNIWGQPRRERIKPPEPETTEKKKRVRHVYPSDEIAHLWAHQSVPDARNPQGNFYFEGKTIWSYGSHFAIATHVTNAKGKPAILFTTRRFRQTTGKHLSAARHAIPGNVPVFPVLYPTRGLYEQVGYFKARLEEGREKLGKARLKSQKAKRFKELCERIAEANEFNYWFGSRVRYKLPSNAAEYQQIAAAYAAAQQVRHDERNARQREEYRLWQIERDRRAAELAEKMPLIMEEWRNGLRRDLPSGVNFYQLPVMLRLSKDGSEIETSLGARVPVEHALKALPLVKRVWERGETFVTNGHTIHLGYYKIDKIDAELLYAGCHRIPKAEVLRITALIEKES